MAGRAPVSLPLIVIGTLCLTGFGLATYAHRRISRTAATPYFLGGTICGVIFIVMMLATSRP